MTLFYGRSNTLYLRGSGTGAFGFLSFKCQVFGTDYRRKKMTNLERIKEWRKGCSCASSEHPEECHECTLGLISAIEKDLSEGAKNTEQANQPDSGE
jgi:hypothetical protein